MYNRSSKTGTKTQYTTHYTQKTTVSNMISLNNKITSSSCSTCDTIRIIVKRDNHHLIMISCFKSIKDIKLFNKLFFTNTVSCLSLFFVLICGCDLFIPFMHNQMSFLQPMEWNDVIYSYDGEHLTGKVNGLEKRVSVTGILIILFMYGTLLNSL